MSRPGSPLVISFKPARNTRRFKTDLPEILDDSSDWFTPSDSSNLSDSSGYAGDSECFPPTPQRQVHQGARIAADRLQSPEQVRRDAGRGNLSLALTERNLLVNIQAGSAQRSPSLRLGDQLDVFPRDPGSAKLLCPAHPNTPGSAKLLCPAHLICGDPCQSASRKSQHSSTSAITESSPKRRKIDFKASTFIEDKISTPEPGRWNLSNIDRRESSLVHLDFGSGKYNPGEQETISPIQDLQFVEAKWNLNKENSEPLQSSILPTEGAANNNNLPLKFNRPKLRYPLLISAEPPPSLVFVGGQEVSLHHRSSEEFNPPSAGGPEVNSEPLSPGVSLFLLESSGESNLPSAGSSPSPPAHPGSVLVGGEDMRRGTWEEELRQTESVPRTSFKRRLSKEVWSLEGPEENGEERRSERRKGSVKPKAKQDHDKDDEVIVIADTEEEADHKPKKSVTNNEKSGAQELCQYPEELCSSTVIVTTDDYKSLEEGVYLNDIIIDFYLTWLHREILNPEDRKNVYVFSTHFYPQISTSNAKAFEKDSSLSMEEKRYRRVERWTKNVDLFLKDMVIFPICKESHWFLVIAVKPGLIKSPENPEDRLVRGEPFLILLDSMGGSQERTVNLIRSYLACEWKKKRGGAETFSAREMRLLKPCKPEQDNFTDCGLYLLHYTEKIFGSVAQFYWSKLPDLSCWFPQAEIAKKRLELATHIQTLAKEQKGEDISFPDIRLSEGEPRRRGRARGRADILYDPQPNSKPSKDLLGWHLTLRKRKPVGSNRPTRSNHHKEASGLQDLFGRDEQRLGAYKIPRRNTRKSDDLVIIASEDDTKEVEDARLNHPAGLEASRFYTSKTRSDRPQTSSGSDRSDPPATLSPDSDQDEREGFRNFLRSKNPKKTGTKTYESKRNNSRKNSVSEKDRFKQFLDSKERSQPGNSALVSSARSRREGVAPASSIREGVAPESSRGEGVAPASSRGEGVAPASSRGGPDKAGSEERGQDLEAVLLQDSSPEVVAGPGQRLGQDILLLEDSDKEEELNVPDPPARPRARPPTQSGASTQSTDSEEVVEILESEDLQPQDQASTSPSQQSYLYSGSRCRTVNRAGVPKIFIDEDLEEVSLGKRKPKRIHADLLPLDVPDSFSGNKEKMSDPIDAKINRLSPGNYNPSKYRLYSVKTSESGRSSMETSGEYWRSKDAFSTVAFSTVVGPKKSSNPVEKKYVLSSALPPREPRCTRFQESSNDLLWKKMFEPEEPADNKSIFSD